jgi:hypothetical protein
MKLLNDKNIETYLNDASIYQTPTRDIFIVKFSIFVRKLIKYSE